MNDNRERILDVALEVLGQNPDAGMGEIASAAGVVRRTVYGHFASRTELVRTLMQRAVSEVAAVLADVDTPERPADAAWVDFVARLWPLADRYRVLLVLRRGEHSEEIHASQEPVEKGLAALVGRGQDGGAFGRHLPATVLGQLAYAAVFALADDDLSDGTLGARAATVTSLLMLGVPAARAEALVAETRWPHGRALGQDAAC